MTKVIKEELLTWRTSRTHLVSCLKMNHVQVSTESEFSCSLADID